MAHVIWQNRGLDVQRLIFASREDTAFHQRVSKIAYQLNVPISDSNTEPQPGDFWLGALPRAGWGDSDPNGIAWASNVEIPVALNILQRASTVSSRKPVSAPLLQQELSVETVIINAA